MNRTRLVVILAAFIIPGGFIALFSAWLLQRASQTERGRKVLEVARVQGTALRGFVPNWMTSPMLAPRQKAA